MKKRTSLFLALLASAVFFLFLFFQTLFFAPPGITVHPVHRTASEDQRINLNLADETHLQELPGIGPALSAAIVSWREEHGFFHSVEELQKVPGIGEKTLAGLREYVYVGGERTDEDSGR